jgi:hypothetical protein
MVPLMALTMEKNAHARALNTTTETRSHAAYKPPPMRARIRSVKIIAA